MPLNYTPIPRLSTQPNTSQGIFDQSGTLTGVREVYTPPPGGVLGSNTFTASSGDIGHAPGQREGENFNDFRARQAREEQEAAAREAEQAEINAANIGFDRTADELNAQLGSLGGQRARSLSELANQFSTFESGITQQQQQAETSRDKQIREARRTAQDVQLKNRNVLRGLGILNSTAAGELLNKPFNEFDRQRGDLVTATNARLTQLGDVLNQERSKHALQVQDIEARYTDLVGAIQRDLRFNERERASAIRDATAALQQRVADINTSFLSFQDAVQQQATQLNNQLASVSDPNLPTFDFTSLQNQTAAPTRTQSVPIFQGGQNDRDRALSALA